MMDFEDLDNLEAQEQVQDDRYEDTEIKGLTFGIIGVGQGGNRIAESFYELGYRKVILFNTTEKDMQGLSVPRKHWVVAKDVEGAGKNPAIGEQAAKDVIPDLIKKMNVIFKNVTNIIICVGAGGGSGTGACGVFADACCHWVYNNYGDYSNTKVGFFVALPSRSESSKVLSNTKFLLDKILNKKYSPILFVDNQRITQAVKANALNRWNQANRLVCSLFDVFNTLSAQETSLDTFDPKDFSDVLSNGIMTMAISSVPESSLKIAEEGGLARDTILSDKVKSSLKTSLLLQDVDISTATHASVLISCRKKALEQMDGNTIPKLSETLLSMMGSDLNKQVTLHRGIYLREDNKEDSKIRIFLMFSGMSFPKSKIEEYENASKIMG